MEPQVAAKRAAHTARPTRQAMTSASRTHLAGLAVEHQPLTMVVHQLYSSLDTSRTMFRILVVSTRVVNVSRVCGAPLWARGICGFSYTDTRLRRRRLNTEVTARVALYGLPS